jgi:hypothetical protein
MLVFAKKKSGRMVMFWLARWNEGRYLQKHAVCRADERERSGADSAGSITKQMAREKGVKLPFMSNNIRQLEIKRPGYVPVEEPLHNDPVTACYSAHNYKSLLLVG